MNVPTDPLTFVDTITFKLNPCRVTMKIIEIVDSDNSTQCPPTNSVLLRIVCS